MQAQRASSAASASSPSAVRRRVVPRLAPSARIASRLLASASRSPEATVRIEVKPSAVRTKSAAGRACRSTPAGNATRASELVCIAGVLRRLHDGLDVGPDRPHDCTRAGPLDERRLPKSDHAVAFALEHMPDREYRAAQVADHDDACAAVGAAD